MPHQSSGSKGLEVVLSMRKTYPNTPVITISGGLQSAPTDFLPIVKNYGTSKVFYKPVELTELLAAIREELGE